VQDALSAIDAVHLAVAYPIDEPDGTTAVAAAVSLRPGFDLDAAALGEAVTPLPPADRPRYVRVVDEIPRTTWYRVRAGALRAVGIPPGESVWVLSKDRRSYRRRTPRPARSKTESKTKTRAKTKARSTK
jgi:acyl-coenzyme A synthetase/AMP-(fatty) acid ligase